MIAALILAAAQPMSAIDAERAFAADAQKIGQWTAFAKWSAPGAVMFVPKLVSARTWLSGRKDPPKSVTWQPAESYQSCDGKTAINVGPWQRADGSFGYFTTVWQYEDALVDGHRWMWVYDGGDSLTTPMPAAKQPNIHRASCSAIPAKVDNPGSWAISTLPPPDSRDPTEAAEHARDRSLHFEYKVDDIGNRHFAAWLWNGRTYQKILDQTVKVAP